MLAIHLIAVGEKMPPWVRQGYTQYAKRIHGRCALHLIEVAAARRGKKPDWAKIARLEAARLAQAIPPKSRVIALDRGGMTRTTAAISRRMNQWMAQGEQVAMLVGGPEGLPPAALLAAHEVWSLSTLTFAHPLVRVLVAEQIYRCFSALEGLPYHR